MNEIMPDQRRALTRALAEREAVLRGEIRRGLARIGRENQTAKRCLRCQEIREKTRAP